MGGLTSTGPILDIHQILTPPPASDFSIWVPAEGRGLLGAGRCQGAREWKKGVNLV